MHADTLRNILEKQQSQKEQGKQGRGSRGENQIYKAKTNKCTDNWCLLTSEFLVMHRCVYTLMKSISVS